MKTNMLSLSLKTILSSTLLIAMIANTQAADNPKPSSWANIDIKITETYGNNQTRPLRGAKVFIDLVNKDQSKDFKTRFPQSKSSGPRGVTFTRMPPSSMVGDYIVTVNPKPSDKNNQYTCKQKEKTFIHNTRKANKQFRFQCFKNSNQSSGGSSSGGSNSSGSGKIPHEKQPCHKVRIQKQEGKRSSTYSKACPVANGNWKIEPYKY